jgi:response regulator of citrate/malate metabolism
MGLAFLLVDDDQDAIFINEYLINQAKVGGEIYKAESVSIAMDLLKSLGKENKHLPDLILLDIRMPVEDGFVFLQKFNELPEDIKHKSKVVMITSSLDVQDCKKAMAYPNVIDYISKPLTLEKLEIITEKVS